MKKIIPFVALAVSSSVVVAQDEDEKKPAVAEAAAAEQAVKPAAPAEAAFTALPFCRKAEFPAEVRMNGSDEWAAVEEGRFYPLGSAFRTGKGGSMTVAFGAESVVSIADGSTFATRAQGLEVKSRTLELLEGAVTLDLSRNLAKDLFVVALPGFTISEIAGQVEIVRKALGDGDEVVVRCVTGSLAVKGRHFDIPAMRAADEIKIRTGHDSLETILYGTSGDYIVKLDQGIKQKNTVDDEGNVKRVSDASALDWHLTPETKVQINRAVPAIGERLSVAVMTFDAAGQLKNNFAFSEGRAEVNSGELVKGAGVNAEELAKKAAEATETTAADVDAEEDKGVKKKDSVNDNKNKEDSDKE